MPEQAERLVYTAHSKHWFFARWMISAYVLLHDAVPLNPFMNFDYFLGDAVPRDLVRRGNNALVAATAETWVFGPISNGVFHEVLLAHRLGRPVRYHTLGRRVQDIAVAALEDLEVEPELRAEVGSAEAVYRALRQPGMPVAEGADGE